MTSIHIPISPGKRLREKSRSISISPLLPTVANGVHEKHLYRSTWLWTTTYYLPLPWPFSRRTGVRRLRITLPIPRRLSQSMKNLGRARSPWSQILLAVAMMIFLWHLYGFAQRHGTPLPPLPFHRERTTRVFSSDDLRRIWEWEVASGHYQSSRKSPCYFFFKDRNDMAELICFSSRRYSTRSSIIKPGSTQAAIHSCITV